jgi:hypothetical protein
LIFVFFFSLQSFVCFYSLLKKKKEEEEEEEERKKGVSVIVLQLW